MDDEVVVSDRNYHWTYGVSKEEILGRLPEPPSFLEDIALVRDRVREIIGKVSAHKVMTAKHPVIARLFEQDDVRRHKPATASYAFSWDNPVFDSPFEQRWLRFLNALFVAVARWGASPNFQAGKSPRDHYDRSPDGNLSSLDRPPAGRRKGAGQEGGPDQLRFAILSGYDREERASWQDGEGGRLRGLHSGDCC